MMTRSSISKLKTMRSHLSPPSSEGTTRTLKRSGRSCLEKLSKYARHDSDLHSLHSGCFSEKMAIANVDKVTLEFGVKVAGEGGVPYITKGSSECNLKITVECSFPDEWWSHPPVVFNHSLWLKKWSKEIRLMGEAKRRKQNLGAHYGKTPPVLMPESEQLKKHSWKICRCLFWTNQEK